MEFHDIANIFPMLTGDEYQALRDDIAANGLLEPIILYEGKILDGRNRYTACLDVGAEPEFELYEGDAPIQYVVSKNLHRRHLTSSQAAVCSLTALPMLEEEARKRQSGGQGGVLLVEIFPQANFGKARDHVAQLFTTNPRYVSDAKRIEREAPDLLPRILSGEMTIPQAKQEMTKPHVTFNSGENEWYTPSEYVIAARNVMGNIDLDPASSDIANNIVNATNYYTKEIDGLSKDWHGHIWMNPPYSGDLIKQFTDKFYLHWWAGDIEEGIILVNNATETKWCQSLLEICSAVCFPKGRIKYLDSTGIPKETPLQGQVLIYFGKHPDLFANQFREFGKIMYSGVCDV